MNQILVISGPTASGKSNLALEIANFRNISIINADSIQIYEGLPILSSQPNSADQKIAPHFLYSYLRPERNCSVGLWLDLVKEEIEKSWEKNSLPIIVGGTGMYISKLFTGIAEIPQIDNDIKLLGIEIFEKIGRIEFINQLILLGEDLERIKNLDKYRLIRCFEVIKQTGKSINYWQKNNNKTIFEKDLFTHIYLNLPRDELYQNCNLRFIKMIENGAIDEVKALLSSDIQEDYQITKTLGFEEIKNFLANKILYEKMIAIASQKTRNYAKRQITWFRNQFDNKISFENQKNAINFLKNYK